MQVIDWFDSANFTQTITIENTLYTISIVWNTRDENWYISVYDVDKNPIITGKRLNLNVDVFNNLTNINIPNGILTLVQVVPDSVISRDKMGSDIILMYISNGELL